MRWKRTASWTAAALVIAVLLGLLGGYVYLRSTTFRNLAIRTIEQHADRALGASTYIGSLDLSLSTLTARLYDVTIRGKESHAEAPLLHVDKLTLSLTIRSILHRQIDLSDLEVAHPVIHIEVNRAGMNNFPSPPPSQSGSTDIFDLAVKHFAITNGEIYYHDAKIPLGAELYDLTSAVAFDPAATRYTGSLSYRDGQLQYAGYPSLPHTFTTHFQATRSALSVDSVSLTIGSSTVSANGTVTNYADPTIVGKYHIFVHSQDFASMRPAVQLAGDIALDGNLQYHCDANRVTLRCLKLNGRAGSDELGASTSAASIGLKDLNASYQLAGARLCVSGVEAQSLGGVIRANVDVLGLDASPNSHLRVFLQRISLRSLQRAAHRIRTRDVVLAGVLDGNVEAHWIGGFEHLRGSSDLSIHGAAEGGNPSAVVPVTGLLHAAYDGTEGRLSLRQSTVSIPSASVTADGEISRHSQLRVTARADDLHQLAQLVDAFNPSPRALPPIYGTAAVTATIAGSVQKPSVLGGIVVQNLTVRDTKWKSVSLSLAADPSRVAVSDGKLVGKTHGRAAFSGNVSLRHWSYAPRNPIRVKVAIREVSLKDIETVAGVTYPVTGELSGDISISGSQLSPSGSASLALHNASAYGEPIQSLTTKFAGTRGSIKATLYCAVPAGSVDATLNYTPATKAYALQVTAPAINLRKLRTVQSRNIALDGTLSASASGQGTLDHPQFVASLQSSKVTIDREFVAGLRAETRVGNDQASFAIAAQLDEAPLHAHGSVALTGNYETQASVDTGTVPLEVLLASFGKAVPDEFHGTTEMHATLKGPLKDQGRLEAHVTIPTFEARYQQLQIRAAAPIHADYVHSLVTLQPADITGTDTSLRLQGAFPLSGSSKPTLAAKGSVDVRILRIFQPELQSSGTVSFEVHASGSSASPSVEGWVHLLDVGLSTPDAPVGVHKLNGTCNVTKDRLQIVNASAEVGGGQVSLGGSVIYRPRLQFNVALRGKSVRLRYPAGLRTLLDTNLTLSGNMQSSSLNGRVLVDSLSFTPDFDLANFADQLSSNDVTPSQPDFANTVNLAVIVQSKSNLSAQSSQLNIEGSANLRVGGTAASPAVIGRLDLTSGELFYRNNRYQLQRGIITFDNPTVTTPNLDVSVTTTVEQYNLTIGLRGPIERLSTSYVSDPPLAAADIINLVAFGKTSSESAAASGSQSTDSMIASGAQSAIGSEFSGGIQKLAGLSSLQIDPLLGGNSQNPSAQIALQQRVTKNFLFTFSTDVSQPGEELVQGEYQINKRWSVSVTRNQVGGISVDGRLHTRF